MTKRFCDCNGCNRKAIMSITAPRTIVQWVVDCHGNKIHKFSDVKPYETDLCSFHAQLLAGCMYEIEE